MFWNKQKKTSGKVVMVFGVFETIHAGIESYLKQAAELGDQVLAVIARDQTVKILTGNFPQNSEKKRLSNLKKSGLVDKAILGNTADKLEVILKYRPDVIALGYNQYIFTQRIEKTLIDAKMDSEIVRLTPYLNNIHRSSLLKTNTTDETKIIKTAIVSQ